MKIAHFAPFAPYKAGIYEAARDMMRADAIQGHEVAFVDTGPCLGNVRQPRQVGAKDWRDEFVIKTVDLDNVKDFDIFIVHDGLQLLAEFFAQTKAAIIKPIHIRPAACYRTQAQNPVYEFYYNESRKHIVKAWFTMWKEFMPYWEVIIPGEKLFCTDDPPIDGERFSGSGPMHNFAAIDKGEFNVVVVDAWREDVDPFHVLHGLLEAAKTVEGLKVHVYGAPEGNGVLNLIFAEMRRVGILGELRARVNNIAEIFRACDLLVSPHVIATRAIGEAICCGLPVLAGSGCRYTPYTCWQAPVAIAQAVRDVMERASVLKYYPAPFALEKYSKKMAEIYEEVV